MNHKLDHLIIAQELIHQVMVQFADDLENWADTLPDIGENDWELICDHIAELTPSPDFKSYWEARDRLEDICAQWAANTPPEDLADD